MSPEGIGVASVKIRGDYSQLRADMEAAQTTVEQALKGFDLRSLAAGLTEVGSALTRGLTVPIVGAGTAVVAVAGTFEQAMNKVRAVTGATGESFVQLEALAKELGSTTSFTASQAADAMKFLAMAGFDANQIMAAMPSTLQLAAAAAIDLGTAADITSNILTGYGMAVEDLTRVNDALVMTFTSSNVSMQQLGQSFKFVGPVAKGAGLAFEEVSAAIGLLGNAGIQGSMAGTALRGAISHLLNPTKEAAEVMRRLGVNVKDSSGNMLPLVEIIRQFERAGLTSADALKIFGDRAGPGMKALVDQGSSALENLRAKLEASHGVAARLEKTMLEGFMGQLTKFKSALEGAAIAIGQILLPAATRMMEIFTGLVPHLQTLARWFGELPEPVKTAALGLAALAAAIGPFLLIAGQVISAVLAMKAAFAGIAAAIGGAGLAGTIGALLPVLAGVAAAVAAVWAAWQLWQLESVQSAIASVSEAIAPLVEWLREAAIEVAKLAMAVAEAAFIAALDHLREIFAVLSEQFRDVAGKTGPLAEAWRGLREAAAPLVDILAVLADAWLSVWTVLQKTQLALIIFALTTGISNLATAIKVAVTASFLPLRAAIFAVTAVLNSLRERLNLVKPVLDLAADAARKFVEWFGKIPAIQSVLSSLSGALSSLGRGASEAAKASEAAAIATDQATVAFAKQGPVLDLAKRAQEDARGAADRLGLELKKLGQGAIEVVPPIKGVTPPVTELSLAAADLANEFDAVTRVTPKFSIEAEVLAERLRRANDEKSKAIKHLIDLKIALADGTVGVIDFRTETEALLVSVNQLISENGIPAIPKELRGTLIPAFEEVPSAVGRGTESMIEFGRQSTSALRDVHQAVHRFVMDAGRALFDGDASFGERLKRMWRDLRDVAINEFLRPVADGIANFVAKELQQLISGLDSAASKMAKLPGGGGGGAAAAPGGSTSGGGGGFPMGGMLDIFTSLGTLISNVIKNFQLRAVNKSLDLIETEVRYTQIHSRGILETLREFLPGIGVIKDMWASQNQWYAIIVETLESIRDAVRGAPLSPMQAAPAGGGGGQEVVVNIYGNINTTSDWKSMLDEITKAIGGQGAQT